MTKVLANDQADATDIELVVQCQQGDSVPFRELYRRYQKRVRSTLYQLCGDRLLDDLVQEVFLRAWKGLPKLREATHFSTWLYRISWNVAIDGRRQFAQHRQQRYEEANNSFDQDEENFSNTISRSQDSPDLMQLHYQDLVQRGLQTLTLEHRAVLVLHDLEDIPQKEVASILNVPVGTVKSRLFHARSAMKKFLQQQGVSI